MQFDMHYYGTFAMAYAAGLKVDDAQIVATAAQLVDDNNLTSLHTLASGQGVLGVATAHHPVDAGLRVIQGPRDDDSRLIWVPFHFLPGAKGDSFEERVVCVKNSDVAREMVRYYTTKETVDAHRGHCLQLIGIAAHVYADTFSHYGFSGIASSLNGVDTKTIKIDGTHSQGIINYVRDKAKDFAERFGANVADTVKLGHGAVATYPDRPYLRWSYILQDGARFERNNPETFLNACEALHRAFSSFRAVFDVEASERASFSSIKSFVQEILNTEADADGRIAKWKEALSGGQLGPSFTVPDYSPTDWLDDLKASKELIYDVTSDRVESPGYNFFVAADYHRNYVLKRLLPTEGLFVA